MLIKLPLDENDYKLLFEKNRNNHSKADGFKEGYTLLELIVCLSILSLMTVSMLTVGFGGSENGSEAAYHAECDKILYTLLQYQNEAMMDGYRRQIRFLEHGMQISWTKDKVNHKVYIPVETLSFSGSYTGATALYLYQHGTVSMGGTVNLTSSTGTVKKIIVQIGNGRIYLNEP